MDIKAESESRTRKLAEAIRKGCYPLGSGAVAGGSGYDFSVETYIKELLQLLVSQGMGWEKDGQFIPVKGGKE